MNQVELFLAAMSLLSIALGLLLVLGFRLRRKSSFGRIVIRDCRAHHNPNAGIYWDGSGPTIS